MTGTQQKHTVGRGGAGNVTNEQSPSLSAADLQTPAISGNTYTTGRGGAGNMQRNTDANKARMAQDVVGNPRRDSDSTPFGRGGAGNVVRSGKESAPEHAVDDGNSPRNSGEHNKSLLDKVKDKIHGSNKD